MSITFNRGMAYTAWGCMLAGAYLTSGVGGVLLAFGVPLFIIAILNELSITIRG